MLRLIPLTAFGVAMLMTVLPIRAEDSVSLPNSIVPVTQHQEALSPAEGMEHLVFAVALKMRNVTDFQARLGRGEHISAEEIAERYAPSEADYQAVTDWLVGEGFTITRRDPHRLTIQVRGQIGRIVSAFQVQFARITLNGKSYVGAVTPPRVPAKIAPLLVGINGLQPWYGKHSR